jgi:hypothetical protein
MEAEKELKKLRKESTGYSQGGWGTFIITFEVSQELMDAKAEDMLIERSNSISPSAMSSMAKVFDEQDSVPDPHPVNKIAHFV